MKLRGDSTWRITASSLTLLSCEPGSFRYGRRTVPMISSEASAETTMMIHLRIAEAAGGSLGLEERRVALPGHNTRRRPGSSRGRKIPSPTTAPTTVARVVPSSNCI